MSVIRVLSISCMVCLLPMFLFTSSHFVFAAESESKEELAISKEVTFSWPQAWNLQPNLFNKFKAIHFMPKEKQGSIDLTLIHESAPHLANLKLVERIWERQIENYKSRAQTIEHNQCRKLAKRIFYCEAIGKNSRNETLGYQFWWIRKDLLVSNYFRLRATGPKTKEQSNGVAEPSANEFLKRMKLSWEATPSPKPTVAQEFARIGFSYE